jgi:hypothetical protein
MLFPRSLQTDFRSVNKITPLPLIKASLKTPRIRIRIIKAFPCRIKISHTLFPALFRLSTRLFSYVQLNFTLNTLLTQFYRHRMPDILNSLHLSTFCILLGRTTAVLLTVPVMLSNWRRLSTQIAVQPKITHVHFTRRDMWRGNTAVADSNCTNQGIWTHERLTNHIGLHWDIPFLPPHVSGIVMNIIS